MESPVTAKNSSLFAQIVAALWIAGWSSFTFATGRSISVIDIIISGIAISAMFIPVYFSIFMDKIKEIKFGK